MMEKSNKKKVPYFFFFCSIRLMPGHVLNTYTQREREKYQRKKHFFFPESRSPSNHKKVKNLKKSKKKGIYTYYTQVLQHVYKCIKRGGRKCFSLVEEFFFFKREKKIRVKHLNSWGLLSLQIFHPLIVFVFPKRFFFF